MKTTKFMRQPFIVVGVQVTEDNMNDASAWCQGLVFMDPDLNRPFIRVPSDRAQIKKHTEAYVGDWILRSRTPQKFEFRVYTEGALYKTFVQIVDEEDDDFGPPIGSRRSFERFERTTRNNIQVVPPQQGGPKGLRAL